MPWAIMGLLLALFVGAASGALERAEPAPTGAQQPSRVVALVPGQSFLTPTWGLEVQDHFAVPSPHRSDYSEVRITVAFRNLADADIPFHRAALGDHADLYPQLQIRDASGVARPLPLVKPDEWSVPGSNLVSIPSGATARWTLGFQVPALYDHALTVEAVAEGQVVAAWDLQQSPLPPDGWSAPAGMEVGAMDAELEWSEAGLRARPSGYGTLVCGDPEDQHVVLVFGLGFQVQNLSHTDEIWPGRKYPDVPAIALWEDGSSAHFAAEVFFGGTDPLDRRSFESVVIPPHADADGTGTVAPPESRGMVFPVPRDGRFGAVELPPEAVILYPPAGPAVWVPISGSPSIDLDGELCDRYQPGISFEVKP
ncbi:MAG: hypothetical protein M3N51_08635 [Actinomycetota bacterium]|nr:hypothetical protein [Actinomycetota bacterium]